VERDLGACIESVGWIGKVTGIYVSIHPKMSQVPGGREGGPGRQQADVYTRVCWFEIFN